MGSIYYINTNPKTWPTLDKGLKTKKEFGNEELIEITYGELDDFPGPFDLKMLMRKSIYNKLLIGEYTISPESRDVKKIIVLNETGNIVTPIKDDCVY